MNIFVPGQCWVSEMEPELGLGVVTAVERNRVHMEFRGRDEVRLYVSGGAPLRRVVFSAGDMVALRDGTIFTVRNVHDSAGLLVYESDGGGKIAEELISSSAGASRPLERVYAGNGDSPGRFDLRCEALQARYRLRRSSLRGLCGSRIELIPHQFYIASEALRRYRPRLLLADEVGLGKTIEACLIMHAMLHRGLASRVLIIVPEPLINQWFVELLRKFNLTFSIIDGVAAANQFAEQQLCLCSLDVALMAENNGGMLSAPGWDLLIIDEAHHLRWFPEGPSPEYELAEKIAAATPSVLLLTATPEHYGDSGHFARLRLLDPQRYFSLKAFRKDAGRYRRMAEISGKLIDGKELEPGEKRFVNHLLRRDPDAMNRYRKPEYREEFIRDLLDRHGIGRVIFRNTRLTMQGFPRRRVKLTELHGDGHGENPEIIWLAKTLERHPDEKILLICGCRDHATTIKEQLLRHINIKTALFHEDMSLLQRDRAAAWFADEDGAQLMICSEIGGEGRNFQFAHYLVLLDLPLDPELLEQRIGRLDRIGQTGDVRIMVPYRAGGGEEVLAKWYHEGLNAFEHPVAGGAIIIERFRQQLQELMNKEICRKSLRKLIGETVRFRKKIESEYEHGRDKLLEYNSFRPQEAAKILTELRHCDEDSGLQGFMEQMFEHFGVGVEEMSQRSYLLRTDELITDALPGLPRNGMSVTCDRNRALSRDDIAFLSWDHPMVIGAIDLFCGSDCGSCAFAVMPGIDAPGLLLETVFVLEGIAPAKLHLERFMPPQPVRIVINAKGEDLRDEWPADVLRARLRPYPSSLRFPGAGLRNELPKLLQSARRLAEVTAGIIRRNRIGDMRRQLTPELERLTALRHINDGIREEEIDELRERIAGTGDFIRSARLRLDAMRLIFPDAAAENHPGEYKK